MRTSLTLILITLVVALQAQIKRADKLYDEQRFLDAQRLYAKAIKKNTENAHAHERLGLTFYRLHQADEAFIHFENANKQGKLSPEGLLAYGDLLRRKDKTDQAKTIYEQLKEHETHAAVASNMIVACNSLAEWKTKPDYWKVENLKKMNSSGNEFAAVPYQGGIIFVSNHEKDWVMREKNPVDKAPFSSIYFADKGMATEDSKLFSTKLLSEYHDGPLTIHQQEEKVYYTQLDRTSGKKNGFNLKIYEAELKDGKVSNIKPFDHNSDTYSVMHPHVSKDGNRLYFASDMEGGQGGFDIYVCQKQDGGWSKPVNLGSGVNTSGNEVFPHFHNGLLYFSSDGHPGYGGLDVFYAEEDELFSISHNAMAPLNSPGDDFAVYFEDEETGYFTSNRSGGVGGDDLYSFVRLEVVEEDEETYMSGVFEYENLPIENAKLTLLDENDEEIGVTRTDEKGNFIFEQLSVDKNYKVRVDGNVPDDAKLFITNKAGDKVMLVNRISEQTFAFEALPYDAYDEMTLYIAEDEGLLKISVFGQIYERIPGDYDQKVEVWLVDDDGELIAKVRTDKDGKFEFKKLSPDDQYRFKVIGEDGEELKMIITDEYGKLVDSPRMKGGKFVYERLSVDEGFITMLDEDDVTIKIKYDENFVISNIYYDYGKWDIQPAAEKELDKLVLILKKNPHIGVELSSHTDSRGNDQFNLELSQKRAQRAKEYIVKEGIPASRIEAKGYGETKLVNHCDNNADCSEDEHAKNRRTEFQIFEVGK